MCEWVCVAAHQWAHNKKFKQHTKALQQQQQIIDLQKSYNNKGRKMYKNNINSKRLA